MTTVMGANMTRVNMPPSRMTGRRRFRTVRTSVTAMLAGAAAALAAAPAALARPTAAPAGPTWADLPTTQLNPATPRSQRVPDVQGA